MALPPVTRQEIENASTVQELAQIQRRLPLDPAILQVFIARQAALSDQLNRDFTRLRGHVSTFIAPDGSPLTNVGLEARIRTIIPPNTYQHVNVETLDSYQFPTRVYRARKIELKRGEWGIFHIPFGQSLQAFVSSAIRTDSIYRQPISQALLGSGLLASIDFPEDSRAEFERQIAAAYWRGQKIEIIVPFDFSDTGTFNITSESSLLALTIYSGRWLRSLFTTT